MSEEATAGLRVAASKLPHSASAIYRSYTSFGTFTLVGDGNIVSPDHEARMALVYQVFVVPKPLGTIRRDQNGNRFYDPIAFKLTPDELQPGKSKPNAGSFDVVDTVCRDE